MDDAAMYTNQQPTRKMMNPAALVRALKGLIKNLGGEDSALQSAPKLRNSTNRCHLLGKKHAKNPQSAPNEPSSSIIISKGMPRNSTATRNLVDANSDS